MSENQLLPDSMLTQADVDFINANRSRPAPNNFKDSMLNQQDVDFIIASNPRFYRQPEYNLDIAGAMERKYIPANVLANQRNLVKEATQVLTFPEGGTTEDKYNYYRDVAKQEEAKRILGVINYQFYNDPKKIAQQQKDLGNIYGAYALTAEQKEQIISSMASQEYEQTVNTFGLLPDAIMEDPDVLQFVGADGYMYFKTARDVYEEATGQNGLFTSIGRRIDYARVQRDLDLKFANQEIDLTTFDALSFVNEYRNTRQSDGLTEEVTQVLYDMVAPIANNFDDVIIGAQAGSIVGATIGMAGTPVGSLAGALGGAAKGAVVGAYTAMATENYQRYRAQIAREAMRRDPTLTQAQALNKANAGALIEMGLDFVGDAVTGGVFLPAFKKLATNLGTKAMRKGAKDAGEALTLDFSRRVSESAKLAFKDFATVWTSEVATEGMQGAVEQASINAISNGTPEEIWRSAWDNMYQAGRVMLVLGGLGVTPKFINTYSSIGKAAEAQKRAQRHIVQAEIVKSNPLTTDNPEKAATLYNKVFNNATVSFNASKLKEFMDARGIDYSQLPSRYHNLADLVAQDPNHIIEIPVGDAYVKLYTAKNGGELVRFMKDNPNDLTLTEASDVFRSIMPFDKTIQALREDRAQQDLREQKRNAIRNEIYTQINEQNVSSAKHADNVSTLIANFYQTRADQLGVDVSELFSKYKLNIKAIEPKTILAGQTPEILSNEVKAAYDPNRMEILYKPDAKFSSVMHEIAHSFLDLSAKMNKDYNNPSLRQEFEAFNQAYGIKDYNSLSPAKQAKIQERFVAHFMQSLFDDRFTSDNRFNQAMLEDFRKYISASMQRQYGDLYRARREQLLEGERQRRWQEENERRRNSFEPEIPYEEFTRNITLNTEQRNSIIQELIADEYRMAENAELDPYNPELDNFVRGMLYSEQVRKEMTDGLIDEPVLASIAGNVDPAFAEEVRQLNEEFKGLEVVSQRGVNELFRFMMDPELGTAQTLEQSRQAFASMRDGITDKGVLNTIDDAQKHFEQFYNEHLTKIKNAQDNISIKAIKSIKLRRSDARRNLTPEVFERLEKHGSLSDNGISLAQFKEEYYPNAQRGAAQRDLYYASAYSEAEMDAMAVQQAFKRLNTYIANMNILSVQNKALTIELRKRLGRKEMTLLNRMRGKTNERVTRQEIYDRIATVDLANTSLRNINPYIYARQAAKARKTAQKALSLGDMDKAYQALEMEQALLAKADLAGRYQQEIDKQLKELKEFYGKGNNKLAGNYNIDYIILGRTLLSRIGMMNRGAVNQQFKQVQTYNPDLYNSAQTILTDDRFNSYVDNLTVSDANDVINTLYSLKAQASYLRKQEIDGKQTALKTTAKNLNDTLDQLPDADVKTTVKVDGKEYVGNELPDQPLWRSLLDTLNTATQKVEFVCKQLDRDNNGFFTKAIYRPVRKAVDLYYEKRKDVFDEIKDVMDNFKTNSFKSGIIECPEIAPNFAFGATGNLRYAGKLELLGFYLHTGNAYNFNVLLNSYGMTEASFRQMTERLVREGVIDKACVDTSQAIWAINKKVGADVQRAHRSMHGVYFKEQQNRTVSFGELGELEGGYVPLIKNKNASFEAQAQLTPIDQIASQVEQQLPKVGNEFTIERTAFGEDNMPVVDPFVLERQLDKELRYAYLQPEIDKVNKLLSDKTLGINQKLTQKYPSVINKVFSPWLVRVANNSTVHYSNNNIARTAERVASFMRRNVGAAIMCFNINNALQQVSGLVLAMSQIQPRYMVQAMGQVLFNHGNTVSAITSESKYMARRLRDQEAQLREAFDSVLLAPSFYSGKQRAKLELKRAQKWSMDHAYWLQKTIQNPIDMATYLGAREQALAQGKSLEDAIEIANGAVRQTQMSFDAIDSSNVEANSPLIQALVQFGNYFFTLYNNLVTERKIAGGFLTARNAYVMFTGLIVPAVIADAINKSVSGEWWEDDSDGWRLLFDNIAGSTFRTSTAMIPVVGQLATSLYNSYFKDKNYFTDTYFNLPAVTVFTAGWQAVQRIADPEKETKYTQIRNALQLAGAVTQIPHMAAIGRYFSYLYGLGTDQINPTSNADAVRGLVFARPSADARK